MTEIDQALVTRIVEAALLASHQPLTLVQLKGLFPLDEPAPDDSFWVPSASELAPAERVPAPVARLCAPELSA